MDYVPTLERAREAGLAVVIDPPGLIRGPRDVLAVEPTRVVRQAAVIVIGSAIRRLRTHQEHTLVPSAANALRLASDEPPIDTPIGAAGLSLLVSRGAAVRCDEDTKRAGFTEHRACRGVGCDGCNDTGELPCPKCRGEGSFVPVKSLYVTEERLSFHNVYSPGDLPLQLDNAVQAMLGRPFATPSELEWREERNQQSQGYRDSARDAHEILGFSLSPALETAQRFLEDTCGGAEQSASRIFGWPLLRLYYDGVGQAVAFMTPSGQIEAHGCARRT